MNSSPNGKLIVQFLLTVVFFGMGIWFLRHEKAELSDVKTALVTAHWFWVVAGLLVTIAYLILQGLLYVTCFHAIGTRVRLIDTINLFLKRNFISVFLPAGGVSSLAFFTGRIESKGISKNQIHYASSIYAFIGIVSVIVVAIPAFVIAFMEGKTGSAEITELLVLIGITILIGVLLVSLYKKGRIYSLLIRRFPAVEATIEDILQLNISSGRLLLTLVVSIFIEFAGIAHVFIAMKALNADPSMMAAVMAYIISVVFLIISPFLRGLGAVEVSMSIILVRFGFSNVTALSVTLLYRFFEFWLPLFAGIISFVSKINKLLMRTIPALAILLLGLINIISAITPAIHWRIETLKEYIMLDAIHASNFFVLIAGFFLLVTAAFMMKGLRSAWWMALLLSIVSLVGHITKAIDYEEASVAFIIIILLLFTRKEYYVKNNPRLRNLGLQTALISAAVIFIYGTVGFYLLHQKHFNGDLSIADSIRYTFANYFLIGSNELVPMDKFGHDFILSINAGGLLSIAFLVYCLVLPYVYKENASEEDIAKAKVLLGKHGKSALDYFKILPDKLIFFPEGIEAFIAYRVTGNYAVVLENPVAANENDAIKCAKQFDRYCYENGLKSIYYRVPVESLGIFSGCGKKNMFIGQEAVVNLDKFSLEGTSRKSIRNAINKIRDKGYRVQIHQPPVKDGILQKIKSVSDEWLELTERKEIIFSQGSFEWKELKGQTIITVENSEEKVIAFLNVIPDYAPNEGTYDLLRKTADAPNGIMDFILIELINYLKSNGIHYLNLGFAPLSGLNEGQTIKDKSIRFAYEKIRALAQYKGLREYKDKFEPVWQNRYLVYDNDYDLIQVPVVLSRVIQK
ncbi:MAG TPA: phosphatidylglycerol lysyltransferase domain-containing protein [Bacteroidales bacterium]|nr:phosphatidylglycerol lysyltransferase domain-containing protein [Bacteroidales bacterium]